MSDRKTCPKCKGRGTIQRDNGPLSHREGDTGRGRYVDETCPRCGGFGKVDK